jgi:Ni,Fe-hydrogenase I cytochrome b subunit
VPNQYSLSTISIQIKEIATELTFILFFTFLLFFNIYLCFLGNKQPVKKVNRENKRKTFSNTTKVQMNIIYLLKPDP